MDNDSDETRRPQIGIEVWPGDERHRLPLEPILSNSLELRVTLPASEFAAGLQNMQLHNLDILADDYDWDGRDPRLAFGLLAALVKGLHLPFHNFLYWLVDEEPAYGEAIREIAADDRLRMEKAA